MARHIGEVYILKLSLSARLRILAATGNSGYCLFKTVTNTLTSRNTFICVIQKTRFSGIFAFFDGLHIPPCLPPAAVSLGVLCKQIPRFILTFIIIPAYFVACNDNPKMSGNPIFPGNYADPEITLFGDTYWIYPTRSMDFDSQVALDAFSSQDLTHWEKHENIIDSSMVKWVRRALWAPSIVEKEGKYFLFFGANDIQWPLSPWWRHELADEDQYGGIGIAVADHPGGPYTDHLGKPLISDFHNNAQPIDQYIFKDNDGQYYIIYGGDATSVG